MAGALIAVVIYNIGHFAGRKPRRTKDPGDTVPSAESHTQTKPRWMTGDYEVAAEWGRDPFDARVAEAPRPSPGTQSGVTGVSGTLPDISGIGETDGVFFVIAADRILHRGDRLGSGRIKTINAGAVVVEYDSGTRTIRLD